MDYLGLYQYLTLFIEPLQFKFHLCGGDVALWVFI